MGANSKIAWTHHTFNPWIGCTKVSEECKFCYAEALMDKRWGKVKWGPSGERQRTSESNWRLPQKWDRAAEAAGERYRVFCASLADVFEARAELVGPRIDLFALIEETPHLDWLLLTKRPENVWHMMQESGLYTCAKSDVVPLPGVWVGTSIGVADSVSRIEALNAVPAAVRFISAEPLLERVVLPLDGNKIHWVIAGCESRGHDAGRFADGYVGAARSILAQCEDAGVAFFHKQMPINGKVSHDPDEWPEDLRVREFPKAQVSV